MRVIAASIPSPIRRPFAKTECLCGIAARIDLDHLFFDALSTSTARDKEIGLTTAVMQKLCGVEEPCYGAMFAREVYHHRTELSAREYCRIGAETEIALRLGDDLPQDGDRSPIAAAVVSAMAAIELIEDLRYDYKRLDAAAMVADNVWYAGVVPAAPVSEWRALDLARGTARPSINGREIGSGK